ncbi:MAG TPA: glycosyltransferase [Gemmatimonadaceae bacterium]|nr:glycosyltransferase [Gemmatimonadaceae bacterium]
MTTPALGIVVPTLNRRESVLRLLHALESQTASDFEVVVVVDGSTDGTAEAVDAYRAPYELRRVSLQRSGLAAARNAGARATSAPIVQFLDDDMEPSPGMVAAHLARQRRGDALGVVGAAPIVVPAGASPIVRYRARGFGRKLDRLAGRRDALEFNDVYGGNVSFGRETLLAAGGYDETFRVYGHEDYELSLRLTRAGHRFAYEPDALAQQYYDKTLRELAADVESEGRTAVAFARKHPDVLSALQLGGLHKRSMSVRARLCLLAWLDSLTGGIGERLLANVERTELATPASSDAERFARYDTLFDILYWLGAERALRTPATPWWDAAIRRVDRWLGEEAASTATD